MKEQFFAGIDTIEKIYPNQGEKLMSLRPTNFIVEKHSKKNIIDKPKLVYKPSKIISFGKKPSSLKESLELIKDFENKNNLNNAILNRIDIAIDTTLDLNENIKLFVLFAEAICVKRSKLKEGVLYKTIKEINTIGNIKSSFKNNTLTIYECSDKNRNGITRIENRVLKIIPENSDINSIKKYIKDFIKEISNLDNYISMIENIYIAHLYDLYLKNQNIHINFISFIECMDSQNHILTKGIVRGFLEKINPKINCDNFIREYRRKRKNGLKFISKLEFQNLLSTIKKELKNVINTK